MNSELIMIKPNITNLTTESSRVPQSLNGHWNVPSTKDEQQSTIVKENSPATTVNLSSEGKTRSIDYGAALKQPKDEIAKQENVSEDDEQVDLIDKQMERIKEEIIKIREQLALLQGDDSESADKQKEFLNAQLMVLNTQLMELASQKLEG